MNFLKKSFTALLATLTLFGTGISTPIVAEDGDSKGLPTTENTTVQAIPTPSAVATEEAKATPEATPVATATATPEPTPVATPELYAFNGSTTTEHYTVTVSTNPGALPEGVTLVASELSEDTEEYKTAKEAVADAKATDTESFDEQYGMAALDIHFNDANGNEVEPDQTKGDVSVAIELKDASEVIAADADKDTLEIHHIDETAVAPKAEVVADTKDTTEGKVTVDTDNNKVDADLAVKSFSTFTITWKSTLRNNVQFYIETVDQSGQEIGNFGKKSISDDYDSIELADYANDKLQIDGYEFESAYVYINQIKTPVTELERVDVDSSWFRVKYDVIAMNGSESVESIAGKTVYLQYKKFQTPSINYHYLDFSGADLSTKTAVSINSDDEITAESNAIKIDSYAFDEAYVIEDNQQKIITSIKRTKTNRGYNVNGYYVGNKVNDTSITDVYLKYARVPSSIAASTTDPSIAHTKTVVSDNDVKDQYNLNLAIQSVNGSINNPAKIDFVFIVDASGSMNYAMDAGSNKYANPGLRRIDKVSEAIYNFTNEIDKKNVNGTVIDAEYALTTFSGANSAIYTDSQSIILGGNSYWTSKSTDINQSVYDPSTETSKLSADGGTNYQAGLMSAKQILKSARSDSSKVVIFLTDGFPTYHYADDGSSIGNTGIADESGNLDAALPAAKALFATSIKTNSFYPVGILDGNSFQTTLETLEKNVNVPAENRQVFSTDNEDDLSTILNKISATSLAVVASGITVVDKLSSNTQFAELDANGNPVISVSVKNGDKEVAGEAANIVVKYPTDADPTFGFSFKAGYTVKSEYTYAISAKIKPTDEAYNKSFDDQADANTGTFAGEMGLFSNDNNNAYVQYTTTDGVVKSSFDKPVIVPSAKLTIKADDANKVYDGTPLTKATASVVSGKLSNGDEVVAVTSGSITDFGSTSNVLDSIKIMHGDEDVTDNYLIKKLPGTLTINKRAVTLTSATDHKIYDGTALTNHNVAVSGDGFVTGEGATYDVTGTQTLPGTTGNVFTYTLDEGTKASNYEITKAEGTLKIEDRPEDKKYAIEVEANSLTDTYDGTEKTASGFKTLEFTENGITYTVSGLTASQTKTDAGTYEVKVEGTAVVMDAAKNDVTAQFAVSTKNGTLTINKRNLTIVTPSASRMYNGTPLTATGTIDGLAVVNGEQEDVTFTTTGTITNVGSTPNTYTLVWGDSTKEANYNVSYTIGTLAITASNQNAVLTSSIVRTYDGTAYTITAEATKAGSTLLYSTDNATWVDVIPTFTDATTAQTVYVKAVNPNYEDAYGQATVTINKRNVTLTSGSSAKEYDGTALTNHNVAVSGDGFVTGESATYNVTGTQTESGFSANTFTYAMNDGTNAANYNVTTVNGTLLVRPVTPVTPTEPETPSRPTTPSTTTNARPSTPNTGDQTNVPFAAGMMSFSMLLAAVAILMKRKYSE